MTPFTREQIAGLRELLAKATPGPWRCNDGPEGYQHRLWVDLTETAFATVCDVRNTSDAALLAAMHEALPALLDIAEAVANAPVMELGSQFLEAWDCYAQVPEFADGAFIESDHAFAGKQVIVLPLAGEVSGNG